MKLYEENVKDGEISDGECADRCTYMLCRMQNVCNRWKLGGNYVPSAVPHKLLNIPHRSYVYSYGSCYKDRFIFLNNISRLHSVIKMVCVLSDI